MSNYTNYDESDNGGVRNYVNVDESPSNPQADLLEKLDMIREAVERNPEQWWQEFEYKNVVYTNNEWKPVERESETQWLMNNNFEYRLNPQRVKVEGWVEPEVIEGAKTLARGGPFGKVDLGALAKALLDCVKESG